MTELHRVFKLKQIFRAWRNTKSNVDDFYSARANALKRPNGDQRKETLTFCVKYTDFCKCVKCESYRRLM